MKPAPRKCALEECGVTFEPTRDDAKYHSDQCRKKAGKARRATEAGASDAVVEALPEPVSADVIDPNVAIEQRVADLEADFDLAEVARRRLEDAIAQPTVSAEQVRTMIRDAAAQVPDLAHRVHTLEQAVEGDASIDRIAAQKLVAHERALSSVMKQLATMQRDLTELAEAVATLLYER